MRVELSRTPPSFRFARPRDARRRFATAHGIDANPEHHGTKRNRITWCSGSGDEAAERLDGVLPPLNVRCRAIRSQDVEHAVYDDAPPVEQARDFVDLEGNPRTVAKRR